MYTIMYHTLPVILFLSILVSSDALKKFPKGCKLVNNWPRRSLDCSYANLTTVPKGLQHLQLNELILRGNMITDIKPADFNELVDLQYLDLRDNPIQDVPAYVFFKRKYLKEIYITSNAFNYAAFDGLTKLTKLIISGTRRLTSLPPALFQPLVKVESITIQYTGLKTLKKFLFANLPRVEIVNLRFNLLKSIPYEVFAKNPNLKKIDLSHNYLESIGKLVIDNNNHMTSLNLSFNRIHVVSEHAFSIMPLLQEIDLSNNKLESLATISFKFQRSMKTIHLQGNNFRSLNMLLLKHLDTLNYLDLSSNFLETFNTSWLNIRSLHGDFPQLKLQNNNITTIDMSYIRYENQNINVSFNCKLRNVILPLHVIYFDGSIDMSNCCLKKIPSAFLRGTYRNLDFHANQLESIEILETLYIYGSLSLSHNKIREVLIKSFSTIRNIDLSYNNLTNISMLSFDKLFTYNLSLSNNLIPSLKGFNLHSYKKFKTLNLAYNKLKEVDEDTIKQYNGLTTLILRGNKLSVIHYTLFDYFQLKTLDLAENNIQKLTNRSFSSSLRFLQNLNLSNNNLTQLSDEFNNLNGLRQLDLSMNSINTILNNALETLTLLEVLSLKGNSLTFLPGFVSTNSINHLDLSNNELHCTCNLTVQVYQAKLNTILGNCSESDKSELPLSFFNSNISTLSTLNCNLCPISPCNYRGECHVNQTTGFQCNCEDGYSGRNCELAFADCYKTQRCGICHSNVCQNNGTCLEINPYEYKCQCPKEYTGKHCETKIHQCSTGSCNDQGLCKYNSTNYNYSCDCYYGFYGKYCEIKCKSSSCNNQGLCKYNSTNYNYSCDCNFGFYGKYCEIKCKSSYCNNQGLCKYNSTNYNYSCDCNFGFYGKYCELKHFCKLKTHCRNGGICSEIKGTSYSCKCSREFWGSDCNYVRYSSSSSLVIDYFILIICLFIFIFHI